MSQIKRRDIRIKIMQVLYAHEISKEPIEKIKKDLITEIKGEDNLDFTNKLISLVIEHEKELDEYILGNVVNWELERMALIDRILMRMSITEMLYFPDIPPKVSINEAIDIAKEYCTKNSGRFVNGILDSVHERLKKENKIIKTGRGLLNMKKKSGENSRAQSNI